ncbi:MAG: site-2 protease family protein [Oscillospiraceae bacterium]
MSALTQQRLMSFAVRLIVLAVAFPVHESAHALTAHWLGDDTAKNQGRITLNPMKHISLWGALFMLFTGVGAANPVPINARNFKKPKVGMAVSSLAGPLSNLILAYLSMLVYRILYIISYFKGFDWSILLYVFQYGAILNIGLAVFNLLPIPPLDGSRILTLVLPENKYFGIMKYEKYIFAVLFVVMFTGLLDKPLSFLSSISTDALWFLTGWVDNIIFLFLR